MPFKIRYNLAMMKPQKALPILLASLLTWGFGAHAQKVSDDDFTGFEDSLLALTQLSEQITLDQLSFRSFRCQERIAVVVKDSKTQQGERREFTHTYTLSRQPDRRGSEKLIFSESRFPVLPAAAWPQLPLLEQPFTGAWIEAFSFENRLANDFKKLPPELIEGRECLVFAFETVPQISATKIKLLDKWVPLRQRGRIWVAPKTFQLVRLVARQTKLPKGSSSYEYRIDFRPQRMFGRSISMPVLAESKLGLRGKTFEVVQEYSKFEPL